MSGRKTNIEPAYRLSIPGVLLPKNSSSDHDTWHPFLMGTEDLLELHQAIRDALGLDREEANRQSVGIQQTTEGQAS